MVVVVAAYGVGSTALWAEQCGALATKVMPGRPPEREPRPACLPRGVPQDAQK